MKKITNIFENKLYNKHLTDTYKITTNQIKATIKKIKKYNESAIKNNTFDEVSKEVDYVVVYDGVILDFDDRTIIDTKTFKLMGAENTHVPYSIKKSKYKFTPTNLSGREPSSKLVRSLIKSINSELHFINSVMIEKSNNTDKIWTMEVTVNYNYESNTDTRNEEETKIRGRVGYHVGRLKI